MKALVGAFNQEKALVGAFSVIVQQVVEPLDRFTALIITFPHLLHTVCVLFLRIPKELVPFVMMRPCYDWSEILQRLDSRPSHRETEMLQIMLGHHTTGGTRKII